MKIIKIFSTSIILSVAYTGNTAHAVGLIPTETGWDGTVILGGIYADYSSSMIAGVNIANVSDSTITSLINSPDSVGTALPLISLDIKYTFSDSRTQIFYGDSVEDIVRFDSTTQLGIRHELSDKSILQLSYLFNLTGTEIWTDPYVTNQTRNMTDRKSTGLRLGYYSIAGSKINAEIGNRNIEIKDERSGLEQLSLIPSDAQLLNREGSETSYRIRYNANDGQHNYTPEITYVMFDADGKAMAYDALTFKLTHNYNNARFSTFTSIYFSNSDFHKSNPIYNTIRSDDTFGLGFTLIDRKLFGAKDWSALASIVYAKRDSNIDFYTSDINLISLGAMYRF